MKCIIKAKLEPVFEKLPLHIGHRCSEHLLRDVEWKGEEHTNLAGKSVNYMCILVHLFPAFADG